MPNNIYTRCLVQWEGDRSSKPQEYFRQGNNFYAIGPEYSVAGLVGTLEQAAWVETVNKPLLIGVLDDDSYLPFGKHALTGSDPRPLGKIPASYFHWLWHNGVRSQEGNVRGLHSGQPLRV